MMGILRAQYAHYGAELGVSKRTQTFLKKHKCLNKEKKGVARLGFFVRKKK